MKPFRVSVPLLVAASDFAVPYDDKFDKTARALHLKCVWFVDRSIVATNGHIMVCISLHGEGPSDKEAFGIAPVHIRAMAGVAGLIGESSVDVGHDESGSVLFSMEVGEKRDQKIGLHVPAVDISARPNYRAVLAQQPSKGSNPHLAFNPEYLRRIAAVNQAQNCGSIKISAWGPSCDPILYENAAGTLFALMAVRGDHV